MNFLRPSSHDLHTEDSNPNFESVNKNVSNKKKNVFGIMFLLHHREFFFFKIRNFTLHFRLTFLYFELCLYHWFTADLRIFETVFFSANVFPDTHLISPQVYLVSTDSAYIDPDCIPSTGAQPYPHFSKLVDNTLKNEALKNLILLICNKFQLKKLSFWLLNQMLYFRKAIPP